MQSVGQTTRLSLVRPQQRKKGFFRDFLLVKPWLAGAFYRGYSPQRRIHFAGLANQFRHFGETGRRPRGSPTYSLVNSSASDCEPDVSVARRGDCSRSAYRCGVASGVMPSE